MQVLGIRATLFDFLEHQACEEDKAKGLDIADYLLKIKPAEAKLQALIKQNPAIRKLIDVFKLETESCHSEVDRCLQTRNC
ncbi:hypothetical protein DXB51_28975 [Bacillus cereus]|nr:hypothetical protein DXB51_28975 [Bacillus cereus]